jgi:hypothetical protein
MPLYAYSSFYDPWGFLWCWDDDRRMYFTTVHGELLWSESSTEARTGDAVFIFHLELGISHELKLKYGR